MVDLLINPMQTRLKKYFLYPNFLTEKLNENESIPRFVIIQKTWIKKMYDEKKPLHNPLDPFLKCY